MRAARKENTVATLGCNMHYDAPWAALRARAAGMLCVGLLMLLSTSAPSVVQHLESDRWEASVKDGEGE